MNAAHARVGSLEIVAALFAVAIIAARPRIRVAEEVGTFTPVQAQLRVMEVGNVRHFEGTCPLVIGRGPDAQLVVNDPEVSRRHARFETQRGTVFLRDLGSSNGTFLNGRPLTSAIELREGDEVDVGTTRVVVEKLRPWT